MLCGYGASFVQISSIVLCWLTCLSFLNAEVPGGYIVGFGTHNVCRRRTSKFAVLKIKNLFGDCLGMVVFWLSWAPSLDEF